jgi:hypothetical protein
VGPLGQAGKEKKTKRRRLGFWAKSGDGLARGPTRLGLGFMGRFGLRLSRPARVYGLATRCGPARPNKPTWASNSARLACLRAALLLGPGLGWAASFLLLSFTPTGRSHVSASVGSGATASGPSAAGKGVCVRVRTGARKVLE